VFEKQPCQSEQKKVIVFLTKVATGLKQLAAVTQDADDMISKGPEGIKFEDFANSMLSLLMNKTSKVFDDNELGKNIPKLSDNNGVDLILDIQVKFGEVITLQMNELNHWMKVVAYNTGNSLECPSKKQGENIRKSLTKACDGVSKSMQRLVKKYKVSGHEWDSTFSD
jgi:hypothetical protein